MLQPLRAIAGFSVRHHSSRLKHCYSAHHYRRCSNSGIRRQHAACSRFCSSHTGSDELKNLGVESKQESAQQNTFRIPKDIQYHLDRLDELSNDNSSIDKENNKQDALNNFVDGIPKKYDNSGGSTSQRLKSPARGESSSDPLVSDRFGESSLNKRGGDSYKKFLSVIDSAEVLKSSSNRSDLALSSSEANDIDLYLDPSSVVRIDDDEYDEPSGAVIDHRYEQDSDWEAPLPSERLLETNRKINTAIRSCSTYPDVLALHQRHKHQLTHVHYGTIANRLSDLLRDRSVAREVLQNSPAMLEVCEKMSALSRRYDTSMLLNLLSFIERLQLPADSAMLLNTLQLLRHKFSELDVSQLLYLDTLLRGELRANSVGSALKMAVPIVLQSKLASAPLPDHLSWHLLKLGFLLLIKEKSTALAEKFMMAIYERNGELHKLSPNALVSFVSGLLDISKLWRESDGAGGEPAKEKSSKQAAGEAVTQQKQLGVVREVLLKEALNHITIKMPRMSHADMVKLLRRLSYAYTQQDQAAYSQALLSKYAERVTGENWSVRAMAVAVFWMFKMGELDETLVSTLFTRLQSVPQSQLDQMDLYVMPLIHAFASSQSLAAVSTQQKHELLDKLLQHHSMLGSEESQGRHIPLNRLGTDLAYLNYHSPAVLASIQQETSELAYTVASTSAPSLSNVNLSKLLQYARLWQAYKLLYPDQQSWQEDEVLTQEIRRLTGVMAAGMGGDLSRGSRGLVRQMLQQSLRSHSPDTVVTGVYTKHLLLLDHLVVVQADGQVVPQPAAAVEKGGVCITDLFVPHNAKLLGVIQVGPKQVLNNSTKLRSQLKLDLQLLAAEGITAVPILMKQLLCNNTDEQRLQYITAALHQHGLFV